MARCAPRQKLNATKPHLAEQLRSADLADVPLDEVCFAVISAIGCSSVRIDLDRPGNVEAGVSQADAQTTATGEEIDRGKGTRRQVPPFRFRMYSGATSLSAVSTSA